MAEKHEFNEKELRLAQSIYATMKNFIDGEADISEAELIVGIAQVLGDFRRDPFIYFKSVCPVYRN